jgi:hypothetical protein
MITWNQYLEIRKRYQIMGIDAEKKNDIERAEYMTGVIRGLDLAFDVKYEFTKEAS